MNKEDILKELVNVMCVHAQADFPLECCWIITTDFKYIPYKNLSDFPNISFVLDPMALYEHEEDAWGIFHSHPGDENPLPSEDDVASTVFDCYKFLVGFAGNVYIYWYDTKLEALRYEEFGVKHLEHGK